MRATTSSIRSRCATAAMVLRRRLTVRLEPPTNSVYAPGTTTVNDVPLLDFAGTSPLLAPGGLTLADVGPGSRSWCGCARSSTPRFPPEA